MLAEQPVLNGRPPENTVFLNQNNQAYLEGRSKWIAMPLLKYFVIALVFVAFIGGMFLANRTMTIGSVGWLSEGPEASYDRFIMYSAQAVAVLAAIIIWMCARNYYLTRHGRLVIGETRSLGETRSHPRLGDSFDENPLGYIADMALRPRRYMWFQWHFAWLNYQFTVSTESGPVTHTCRHWLSDNPLNRDGGRLATPGTPLVMLYVSRWLHEVL